MSWTITAVVATVAAGTMAAKAQKDAAEAQEIELEQQAEQERISAEGRELQRRQKLNKILAANVVGQSTSGMSGEGTPESIALESAKQASISEGIESLSDRLRQDQLKRQAKQAFKTGQAQATSTLLSTGSKAASLGG